MRYTNTWLLYVTVLQTSVTYIIAPQTSSGAKNTKDTKQNKITLTPTNWLQLRKRCKTKPKPKPTVSVSHIMLVCICTVHIQLCTIVVDRTVLRLILQTSITQVLFMRRKVGGGWTERYWTMGKRMDHMGQFLRRRHIVSYWLNVCRWSTTEWSGQRESHDSSLKLHCYIGAA